MLLKKLFLVRLFLLIYILFHSNFVEAQNYCEDSSSYKSFDFGDGEMQFYINLNFKISTDSIFIMSGKKNASQNDYTGFKILSKECQWLNNFSEGESTYKLEIRVDENTKSPTLVIKYKNNEGIIKLLYDNDETRVFHVKKVQEKK
jgi:hypothetical protein